MLLLSHRFLFCLAALLWGHGHFLNAQACPSGKEGNIWYFGDSLGLDFNTRPPAVLTNSRMNTYEASTIVSDANGQLLFYSNGEQVWDRNHQVMPSVQGIDRLKGSESATHILALPKPGNENLYYLFYMEVWDNVWTQPVDSMRKMYYAIVDLNANGGLGDVVLKNELLFEKTTEKVAAARHCNGTDWWVLTLKSGSNEFLAWKLDAAGLSSTPVVSAVGKVSSPAIAAKVGALKFSRDGLVMIKVGCSRITFGSPTWDAYIELFRFDNASGTLSNPLLLWENTKWSYGAEFSPDSRKLYLNAWTPGDSLYQYDLCVYDSAAIRASKVNLGKAASNTGQMLLGPDGQIYLTSTFRKYLSVIRYPNRKGVACQYEPASIPLPREALLGLPTFPASYYAPQRPYIAGASCVPLCADTLVRYHVAGDCTAGSAYAWAVQGGTVAQQQRDTAWVRWQVPGQGYVTVERSTACGVSGGDTAWVEVKNCQPPAAQQCLSGKEGNIWYFGDSLGLDFNTLPPQILTNSRMNTYEASTIVSDAKGQLLFYSNGEQVWDRNHQVMPSVVGVFDRLKGSESATHTIAVPNPGNSNQYYLFYPETFDNLINQPADTLRKMYYAIIDLSANGGLGDVISKDNVLFVKTTEKIAVTQHCNGRDWWVVTTEAGSNRYFSWLVDVNGLSNQPVVSVTGKINKPFGAAKGGSLKFSPNGRYLHRAVAAFQNISQPWSWDAFSEIALFSNKTGQVEGSFVLTENVRRIYGAEFSPDSRKLYLNAWTPGDSLYQYDLCVYDSAAIRASKVNLGKAASNTGQMLLGPDGQIYLTSTFRKYLSVIRYPNRKGAACQYEPASIPLPREALLGLPTFPASYYAPQRPYIAGASCTPLCSDTLVRYHIVGDCRASSTYAWSVQGGTVVQQQRDTAWVRWQVPGQGYVTVERSTACGVSGGDTAWVEVRNCQPPAAQQCLSGKEGNIWYFGDSLGLDFNTAPPQILSNNYVSTYEASTIVSDAKGQLLFYSNGERVWDRNHQVMPSVQGIDKLKGSQSATHILALPKPGSESIYYLFYMEVTDNVWTQPIDSMRKIYYSIIDLNANGGLGDVVLKNELLFEKTTEKVAAVRHCNGTDWWVLTLKSGSNEFLAWKLDAAGLSNTPVSSPVGRISSPAMAAKVGALKFSPDGATVVKVGAARRSITNATWDAYLELFRFDNASGALSNPVLIWERIRLIYGAEFSPDSRKLYLNAWTPGDSLYQYDLCVYDSAAIRASKVNLGKAASNTGQMLLGPDGQIYLTSTFRKYLSVIRRPNLKGAACQYEPASIPLPREALLGLPTFPASYYAPQRPYIAGASCTPLCSDTLVRYHIVGDCRASSTYAWSVQGGTVVQQQRDTAWVRWQVPGQGYVTVERTTACGVVGGDTVWVEVQGGLHFRTARTCNPALVGTDTMRLQTLAGCDSLIVTATTLSPSFLTEKTALTCQLAEVGSDTLFLKTAFGCDSLIVTATALSPSFLTEKTALTCQLAEVGTDTVFLKTAFGCDSLIVTATTLSPSFLIQKTALTCQLAEVGTDTVFLKTVFGCDSLVVTATTLSPSFLVQKTALTCQLAEVGTDTVFLKTAFGCDSLIVTATTLSPSFLVQKTALTCQLSEVGTDTVFLKTAFGCDSLIVTTTTLSPSFLTEKTALTCQLSEVGTDTVFLKTAFGCDSLIVTATTLSPSFLVEKTALTCQLAEVGSDTLFLKTVFGCDSLIVTATTLSPSFLVQKTALTCQLSEVGTDTVFLKTAFGCDSLIVTATTLSPSFLIQKTALTCHLAEVGTDTVFLKTVFGCDSLVVTATALSPSFLIQKTALTCQLAEVGTDTVFLKTAFGCDSLIVTATTLSPSFLVEKTALTCQLAEVGTDTVFLKTTFGCDSLVVTATTLSPSFLVQKTALTCHLAEVGTDTVFLKTAFGCDSLVVTATTLSPSFLVQKTALTCHLAEVGTDTVFLKTAFGCDSLIVTATTLSPSFLVEKTALTCQLAEVGSDTIFLKTAFGCDSLIVTATTLSPSFLTEKTALTCQLAEVGTDTVFLKTAFGCDSLIVTATALSPIVSVDLGLPPAPLEPGSAYAIPLSLSHQGQFDYAWSPPDGLSCIACPDPVARPLQTTTYTLLLTDANGCTFLDSLTLRVQEISGGIYVPNALTLTGAAPNGRLTVYAHPTAAERVEWLRVYDRWGGLMFEGRGFAPNDESAGWDGTWRGQRVQPGVYLWQAEIRLPDGSLTRKNGDVTVVE